MTDDTAFSRIENKLDNIDSSVHTLTGEIVAIKTKVSQIPGSIDAAITKHQLLCIQEGVKGKMAAPHPMLMPKVIVPLVSAITILTGLIVYLIKG